VASKGGHRRSGCIHLKPVQPCSRSLIHRKEPHTTLDLTFATLPAKLLERVFDG
jgi:hypothetical protein